MPTPRHTPRAPLGFHVVSDDPTDVPDTFPRGRRCQSCECHLSIYNGTSHCWIHGGWLGARERPEAALRCLSCERALHGQQRYFCSDMCRQRHRTRPSAADQVTLDLIEAA